MKKKIICLIIGLFIFLPFCVKAEGFTLTYNIKGIVENVSDINTISLKNAKKAGYIFNGWSSTNNGKVEYKANDTISLTQDTTLYAIFTPIKYTISFNGNGGTGKMSKITCTYDQNCKLPSNVFSKKNSKFYKWNTKNNGKGQAYNNKQVVKNLTNINKKNIVLYAIYGNKYTVTFNGNGGKTSKKSITVYRGFKYGNLPTATKKYYTFVGWYTSNKGGTKITSTNIYNYSKNTVLYARWKLTSYKITYKLNGGTNNKSNPSTYNINSSFTLKNPTKANCNFKGWYTDSKYKNKITKISKGTSGNKTLYAKWETKALRVDKTSTNIDLNKSTKFKVTFSKPATHTVSYSIADSSIVSAKWDNTWNNKSIYLTVTGKKAGKTTVTLTNNYNKDSIKLTIVVNPIWKNVVVEIPETMGESDTRENRIKILKYNFAEGYSDSYKMYITYQLVQYKKPTRSNWGEYALFYDKNGTIIDRGYIYAGSLALGNTYTDYFYVPNETAKIVFPEYPDSTNSSITGNEEQNTDTLKWTSSEASSISEYAEKASEYAENGFSSATNAYPSSAYTYSRLYYAKNYIQVSKSYLQSAKSIAEQNYDITDKNGETLLQLINKAIEEASKADNVTIDSSNPINSYEEISDIAQKTSSACLLVQSLTVSLLGNFTN